MICMICILAGIAPGNMHFAGGQIDHQGADRALPVKGIDTLDIVIADRVGQVDMILLDRLQRLDGMCGALS